MTVFLKKYTAGSQELALSKTSLTSKVLLVPFSLIFLFPHNLALAKSVNNYQGNNPSYLQAKINELQTENEELQKQLRETSKGVEKEYTQELSILQKENEELKTLLSEKGDKKAISLSKKLSLLERDNQKLQNDLAEIEKRTARRYEQKLIDVAKEYDNLKRKMGAQSEKAQGVSQQDNKLKQAYSEAVKENEELKEQLKSSKEEIETVKKNINDTKGSEDLTRLQNEIAAMEAENRKLGLALADMTTKSLSLEEQQKEILKNAEKGIDTSAYLEKIANLEEENDVLKKQLTSSQGKQKASDELEALKSQNLSLRETIKAQSEVLEASGESAKVIAELKQKNVELEQKLNAQGGEEFQDSKREALEEAYAKLKDELVQKNEYIQSLKDENEHHKQKFARLSSNKNNSQTQELMALNSDLESKLKREKESNVEYRKKIKAYQDQLAGVSPVVSNQSASDEQLAQLQMENQDLRAMLNLKNEKVSKSPVFKNQKQAKLKDELLIENVSSLELENILSQDPNLKASEKVSKSKKNQKIANSVVQQAPHQMEKITASDHGQPTAQELLEASLSNKGVQYFRSQSEEVEGEAKQEVTKGDSIIKPSAFAQRQEEAKRHNKDIMETNATHEVTKEIESQEQLTDQNELAKGQKKKTKKSKRKSKNNSTPPQKLAQESSQQTKKVASASVENASSLSMEEELLAHEEKPLSN